MEAPVVALISLTGSSPDRPPGNLKDPTSCLTAEADTGHNIRRKEY